MNLNRFSVLAMDLGGTKLLCGIVDNARKILFHHRYPSPLLHTGNYMQVMKEAADIGLLFLQEYRKSCETGNENIEIKAVGIGVPWCTDPVQGTVIDMSSICRPVIPAQRYFTERFCLPVGLDNDVRCALCAEIAYGNHKEVNDLTFVNIGTGLAAAFRMAGQILTGPHSFTGETGHMVVDMKSDVRCECGRFGCAEALASGIGLHNRVLNLKKEYPDTKLALSPDTGMYSAFDIFHLARKDDRLCRFLYQESVLALATLLRNLTVFSDAELFVLGGGIIQDNEFFNDVLKKLSSDGWKNVEKMVVRSHFKDTGSGMIGASIVGGARISEEYRQIANYLRQ